MKAVSVLVPTANQPKLLETALHSIARQIGRDQIIEEVLVSENLLNRESQAICRKFPNLPIRYTLQDPPLSLVYNFDFLFNQARADVVAMLCDDDWWGPGHLQGAVAELERHESAVARFSACLHIDSAAVWTGEMSQSPILWLAAGRPSCCEVWCLEAPQVLAAAWIQTPFHWSSLVAWRSALQQVAPTWKNTHSHQSDRTLQVSLAALGTILYEPLVDTVVRTHPEAATWSLSYAERAEAFRKCTEMIWEMSAKFGVDLVSGWHTHLGGVDGTVLEETGKLFRMALGERRLKTYGFGNLIPPSPVVRVLKKARTIAKNRWRMYKPAAWKNLGLVGRQTGD